MPRVYKHWGSLEEQELDEMVADKTRDRDIAKALGRTESSIAGKRRNLSKTRFGGVNLLKTGKNRAMPAAYEDRRLRVLQIMQRDLSYMEMVKELGMTTSTLSRLLKRMVEDGLLIYTPPPKNPYSLAHRDPDAERTPEEHQLMEKIQLAMSGKKRARKD